MKNLKNLGKALTKAEQQTINGGTRKRCWTGSSCRIVSTSCLEMQCQPDYTDPIF
ncbi:hypothetical protein [Lacinutrix sp. MEBiC02595]